MPALSNWAGNVTFRARTVYRPANVTELQRLVASSGRIRALGSGHSFSLVADTVGDLVSVAMEIPQANGAAHPVTAWARIVELGRFNLVGIPPAPRGVPQIEVTFDIDANGIVSVSAKDLGTGKQQSIKITAPKKLSKEEIEKMVHQAEQFAADDAKKKEEVEAVNQADTLAYSVEKSLKDYGDKISQAERAEIEAKLNDLKNAIKDKNPDRIKKGMDELQKASHKLAEEVYKQASSKGQPGPDAGPTSGGDGGSGAASGGGNGKKGDDVIDAEFREEKK